MGTSAPIKVAPGLFAFSNDVAKCYYIGQQFVYGELATSIDKGSRHKSRIKELEEGISWTMDVLASVTKDNSTVQVSLPEERTKPLDEDEHIAELEDALVKHLQVVDTAIKKVAELQQQAEQKDVNTNRIMENLTVTKTEMKRIAREKEAIITDLRTRADGLEKELAKTKKDRDEYHFKFEAADSSIAEIHQSFKECYDEVQAKVDLAEQRAADAEKALHECKEECDALKAAKEKSEKIFYEAEETTAHLKRSIELESKVMAVQGKLDDEQDEHDKTKYVLRTEEEKHGVLEDRFKVVYGNLGKCNQALQEANGECDQLNNEIDKLIDERNERTVGLEETARAHEKLQRDFNDKAYEVLDATKDLNIANKKIGELQIKMVERNQMADIETQTEVTTTDDEPEHEVEEVEVDKNPETVTGNRINDIAPPSTPVAATTKGGDSVVGSTRRSSDAEEFETATEYPTSASTEENTDSDVETAREGEGGNDGDDSTTDNYPDETHAPIQTPESNHGTEPATKKIIDGVAASTAGSSPSIGSWSDDYDDYDDATFVPRGFKTQWEPNKLTSTSPSVEASTNEDCSTRAKKLYLSENRLFSDTQHMAPVVKLTPLSSHPLAQGRHQNVGCVSPPIIAQSVEVFSSSPEDELWVTINFSASPVGKDIFLDADDDMTSISESSNGGLEDGMDEIYFEEYKPEMYTYEMCASLNAGALAFVPASQEVAPNENEVIVAATLPVFSQVQLSKDVSDHETENIFLLASTDSSADSTSVGSRSRSSVTDGSPIDFPVRPCPEVDFPITPTSSSEKNYDAPEANETSTTATEEPTNQAEETAETLDTVKPTTSEKRNDTIAPGATEPNPTAKPIHQEVKHTNTAVQPGVDTPKASTPVPKTKSRDLETTQSPHPNSPDQKTLGHGMQHSKWADPPTQTSAQSAAQISKTPPAPAKKTSRGGIAATKWAEPTAQPTTPISATVLASAKMPHGGMAASRWASAAGETKTPMDPKTVNSSGGEKGGGSGGRGYGGEKGRGRRGY